eukprot:Ihof_evm2s824 gene=Ihof_evmTU2s824
MVHVLVVNVKVTPGNTEKFVEQFKLVADHVKANEPECLTYFVSVGEEPDTLVIIERYTSKDALVPHNASAPFKAFFEFNKTSGLVADLSIKQYT